MDATIVITDNDINLMMADFERTWQRPPRENELQGLLEEKIREEIAYRDTWGKGADSFLAMLYERLILMYDLLADDGSLYLHIFFSL